MTFSNPGGAAAISGAEAYVQALLDLIGDRDPLEIQAELLPWLDERLADVDDEELRRPEAPGKWSVLEVVQHLADSEMINGYRLRIMLEQDEPPIQGYDQDRWASVFRYREVELEMAMAQLRALRAANLRIWRSLSDEQLARVGRHSERGLETVGHLIRLVGAHDLVHRRQINRILG